MSSGWKPNIMPLYDTRIQVNNSFFSKPLQPCKTLPDSGVGASGEFSVRGIGSADNLRFISALKGGAFAEGTVKFFKLRLL